MSDGPGGLGVGGGRQVTSLIKDQLVELEAVLTQEKISLIEAMLSEQGSRSVILQGRFLHWLEGAEVGAIEAHLLIEPVARLQHFAI